LFGNAGGAKARPAHCTASRYGRDKADGGTSITRPLRAPADGNTNAIFDRGNTAYVGSTVDFFDDGGTDRAVAEQTNGTTARVYADSNCTMGADLAVQIIGNVLANLQHERLIF
jgi:hypothetical protein